MVVPATGFTTSSWVRGPNALRRRDQPPYTRHDGSGTTNAGASALSTTETTDAEYAVIAARAAADKLAADTVVLSVGDVLSITEFFVITSGASNRQVKAIAEEVEEVITDHDGTKPIRIEGLDTSDWILLDYGTFVVHVFSEDAREFYQLERLWSDVPKVAWQSEDAPTA